MPRTKGAHTFSHVDILLIDWLHADGWTFTAISVLMQRHRNTITDVCKRRGTYWDTPRYTPPNPAFEVVHAARMRAELKRKQSQLVEVA